MPRSRAERTDRRKSDRRRLYAAIGLFAVGLLTAVAATAMALRPASAPPVEVAADAEPATAPASLTSSSLPVEVPDVVGEPLAQAEIVLTYAGFEIERREMASAPPSPDRTVVGQNPVAGEIVDGGTLVVLFHAPAEVTSTEPTPAAPAVHYVVCIDPGHQRTSDQRPEPIGPGSSETKMRVTGGATGVATGRPEHVFTLEVSERVRKKLEAAGVQVVMTRTSHDVSLSNSERAQVANKAGADLFLRIHADGNADRTLRGISTLYPARNTWTVPIAEDSKRAAGAVQAALVAATGAKDRGTVPRNDISGFNWSKVPAVIVECGFMSNAEEDALLASGAYQEKLAEGMTNGVLTYLKGK